MDKRFLKWFKDRLGDSFDLVDPQEFDPSLSTAELMDEAEKKFGLLMKKDEAVRVRRLVVISSLIPKIPLGEKWATYRNRPLALGPYVVVCSRWGCRHNPRCPQVFVEVTKVEPFELSGMTDEDAQLAGVESAEELKRMLVRWYGLNPRIYRNWFRYLG
jgi:acyl carrier protein